MIIWRKVFKDKIFTNKFAILYIGRESNPTYYWGFGETIYGIIQGIIFFLIILLLKYTLLFLNWLGLILGSLQ